MGTGMIGGKTSTIESGSVEPIGTYSSVKWRRRWNDRVKLRKSGKIIKLFKVCMAIYFANGFGLPVSKNSAMRYHCGKNIPN